MMPRRVAEVAPLHLRTAIECYPAEFIAWQSGKESYLSVKAIFFEFCKCYRALTMQNIGVINHLT